MRDEWEQLGAVLRARGVRGVADLGHFVNDTRYFAPSTFDQQAAMSTLLEALPQLSDPRLVWAVAHHLNNPWARPAAFEALHAAFLRWADADHDAGWALGAALATAATVDHVDRLLLICTNARFGMARQMVVDALYRFKKVPAVAETLVDLVDDPDVGLHAMGALRRVIGNAAAIPILERIASEHPDSPLGAAAIRTLRKDRRALDRQVGCSPRRGGRSLLGVPVESGDCPPGEGCSGEDGGGAGCGVPGEGFGE